METKIQDGRGTGERAKVNSLGQLSVNAVGQTRENFSTEFGNAYQVTCGSITLTNDSASALLYIKNESDNKLVLDRVVLIMGVSDGTGDAKFQTLRNPTAGTIITNELQAGTSNSNHGSNNTLDGLTYKGVQGDTFTDGAGVPIPIQPQVNRSLLPLNRVIPKGSSIGWNFTPPAGNTNCNVVIVAHVYYLDLD
jgi:hypothetical protein